MNFSIVHGTTRAIGLSWHIAALIALLAFWSCGLPARVSAQTPAAPAASGDELLVEVHKKGVGKEAVIHKGNKEWYMLVEVAEGTTVIIRQEKDGEIYLLDESETHDRALSGPEIDGVIEDFINSVKTRAKDKK